MTYTLQHQLARLSAPEYSDSDASSTRLITIFVAGTSIRTLALRVPPHWTVSQVMATLRLRRAIAPLERVRQYVVFPPYSTTPLHPDDRLQDIGMQELSTLHVRTCVMGGSPRGQGNPEPSALHGKGDFALIRHAEVADRDSHYDMPRVVLQSRHSLVPIQVG